MIKMSYTPITFVDKEEFDVAFVKISSKVYTYHSNWQNYYRKINEFMSKEKERLLQFARDLGHSDTPESKEKAEKIVEESKEYKKLEKEAPDYWVLGDILENHSEEEFATLKGHSFYYFFPEHSGHYQELKKFCEVNKVSFYPKE